MKSRLRRHAPPAKLAFSLVELSIVLVILGLLVGGVLSGRDLIKAAEQRTVAADFQRYSSAVLSFRDKYATLPGDMPNAVSFWGAQAGGTADGKDSTCAALTTPATTTATCNGDGDGVIDYDNQIGGSQDDSPHEPWRAWQHLANAGLIEGQYTGIGAASPVNNYYVAGSNVPKSRIPNAIWGLWVVPSIRDWAPKVGVHYITFGSSVGSIVPANSGRWHNEVLTPEQQWNLDTKLDDGKPYTGKLTDIVTNSSHGGSYTPNCTTTETFATANYKLSNKYPACLAMMQAPF